jgi:hypothetical protein
MAPAGTEHARLQAAQATLADAPLRLEAFAVIYRDFIADIRRVAAGQPAQRNYPTVHDGLRGLQFIARCVESSERGATWVAM